MEPWRHELALKKIKKEKRERREAFVCVSCVVYTYKHIVGEAAACC